MLVLKVWSTDPMRVPKTGKVCEVKTFVVMVKKLCAFFLENMFVFVITVAEAMVGETERPQHKIKAVTPTATSQCH